MIEFKYKHYSFDLWNTLITHNSEFSKKRTEYFYSNHNPNNLTTAQIRNIISTTKNSVDYTNMITGGSINHLEILSLTLYNITKHQTYSLHDLEEISELMHNMFLVDHPILFSNTKDVLCELKDAGKTISLLSNTGFTPGKTLDDLLCLLDIKDAFDYTLYSDEYNMSKPNMKFFNAMFTRIPQGNISKHEVLHVGDNKLADIDGATIFGINSFQIHSNSLTIKDIL